MVNASEIVFIVQFLVAIAIMFFQLYNVMSVGKIYDYRKSILLFCGSLLAYGVGLVIFLLDVETLLYGSMMFIQSVVVIISGFLFVSELFLLIASKSQEIMPRMGRLDKEN